MRRRQPSLLSIFKNTDKTRGRQLHNDGCSGGDSPPCPLVVLQMSTTVYFRQPGCSHNKAPGMQGPPTIRVVFVDFCKVVDKAPKTGLFMGPPSAKVPFSETGHWRSMCSAMRW